MNRIMRESCELRIDEDFAGLLFAAHEGKRVGSSIRRVELLTSDPRFREAGRLQRELRQTKGKPFFYGWNLERRYTKAEYSAADILRLDVESVFEPAGEECGTQYDEVGSCPICGAGAKQTSDLFMRIARIPRKKDICRTIGGEIVVSKRFSELCKDHKIGGIEFRPIRVGSGSIAVAKDWFQLWVVGTPIQIIPPTSAGNDPFDPDPNGQYRCQRGDLIGLNILSEAFISSDSWRGADVTESAQYIGVRRGLLRPEPLLIVSARFWKTVHDANMKGFHFEVAHVV